MENFQFLLSCFILAFAAINSVHSIQLNCSSTTETILVWKDIEIEYPGGDDMYQNFANCWWLFKGLKSRLKFTLTFLEVEECYDYVLVNNVSRICGSRNTFNEEGDNFHLSFHSDGSNVRRGFRARIQQINTHCDFGETQAVEAMTVFTLQDHNGGSPVGRRGVDFTNEKKIEDIVSIEIISAGSPKGMELCFDNNIEFPVSDIPSCNAADLSNCGWQTKARYDEFIFENTIYSGAAFSTVGGNFRAISSSLRLEKICMSVKYFTQSSDARLSLDVESVDGRKTVTTKSLLQGIWDLLLILADVPSLLQGKNIRLIMDVESSSSVYVNMIQGCNPYSEEDRYLLPFYHTNGTIKALTRVFGLNVGPPNAEGCRNGGRLIQATDPLVRRKCTCLPGFSGDDCGIACGPNKIGPNCEVKCSSYAGGCRHMIICKNATGCFCAPGWKGDKCEHECSRFEYGASCRDDCGHCKGGEPCDPYSGECRHGCAPGFIPPLCQTKFIYLESPPLIEEENYTSAKLRRNFRSGDLKGEGVPKYYKIQYKDVGITTSERWTDAVVREIPGDFSSGFVIEETIRNLTHGRLYESRIILLDEQFNSYEGEDLPMAQIETKCNENHWVIEADNIGEDYLELKWKSVSTEMFLCGYDYYNVGILERDWRYFNVTVPFTGIKQLLPNYTYHFKVEEIGKYSTRYFFANFTTLPRVTGEVEDLKVVDTDKNSVQLMWKGQPTIEEQYQITYECVRVLLEPSVDCTNETKTYNVTNGRLNITALRPFTRYSVRVRQLPGDRDTQISATTALFVENLDIRFESSSTNTSIDVNWKMNCSMCYVISRGYFIKLEFQESLDGVETEGRELTFTEVESYSFQNLRPGTTYKISLYVSDKSGTIISEPFSTVVRTHFSAPPAVRELSVYKVGRRSVGLRWKAPPESQPRIERFTVGVNGLSSEPHKPSHCHAWPQHFCYTIHGLAPDTDYNLSVSVRYENIPLDGVMSYVTAKTTESAPEAPTDLRAVNVTETSVTLSWAPPFKFHGTIRSFLVKIEHTESKDPSHCCNYVPKLEVPFTDERPLYHAQVSGLMSASTYAVSVMAETAWVGQAATSSFSTRPTSPTPVPLPATVKLQLSDPAQRISVVWPGAASRRETEPDLKQTRNLLVLSPEGIDDSGKRTTSEDDDLLGLIRNALGNKSFNILTEYNEGDEITLTEGSGSDSLPSLERGQSYALVAVTVDEYCGLHSIGFESSPTFVVP